MMGWDGVENKIRKCRKVCPFEVIVWIEVKRCYNLKLEYETNAQGLSTPVVPIQVKFILT